MIGMRKRCPDKGESDRENEVDGERAHSECSKYVLNWDSVRSCDDAMTWWTCKNSFGKRFVKYAKKPSGILPTCRLTLSGRS